MASLTASCGLQPVVVICANLICVAILTILFYLSNNLHQLSGTHRLLEVFVLAFAATPHRAAPAVRSSDRCPRLQMMWMSFGKMGGGGGMGQVRQH